MKTILLGAFILIADFCFGQGDHLFKIIKNGKVGYINKTGKMVIAPAFLNGDDFSEGLAPVRKNGFYGYINQTGEFVIKPQYDLATTFHNGIAAVYLGANPMFINRDGRQILPKNFKALRFITKTNVIVKTMSGKEGCIDLQNKKLYIDTIFNSIGQFKNGVAIVYKYNEPAKNQEKKSEVGLIDKRGNFIVPFGKYEGIKKFIDGYALVEIKDKNNSGNSIDGVIDSKGHLLFKMPYKNSSYISSDFHNGIAVVSLYKYWIPEKTGVTSTTEKGYEGYINLKGNVILNDTNYRYVNNYSCRRAFLNKRDDDYFIVDTKLKRIGKTTFDYVLNKEFKDGYAIVKTDKGWGVIDTNANFVVKPHYEEISEAGIIGNYFFFSKPTENDDRQLFGIADLNDKIILKPVLEEFDRNGFVNGLIKVIIGGKISYVNKQGTVVWQEIKSAKKKLRPLNIDYMYRGYFYAYSTPKHSGEKNSGGGWAISTNLPKKINNDKLIKNKFVLSIDTNKKEVFEKEFLGYTLSISNATNDTIKFDAEDSRLYLELQAQNNRGEWKDIEYLPNSTCGNSYHTLKLEPDAYWAFTIPKYEGEIKTRVRAKLKYVDKDNGKKTKVIYSNIINASINPSQFWNKQEYIPNGIMDPYNE